MTISLADADATAELAAQIAPKVQPGEIVLLSGPLGAGKTTFARAFIRARGWSGAVRSPSYPLLVEYPLNPPVFHADLYRVNSAAGLGMEDLLGHGVGLVEWPENAGDFFDSEPCWRVDFAVQGEGRLASVSEPDKLPPGGDR